MSEDRGQTGGVAMCDPEDYTDPAIAEEMHWHAFERALAGVVGEPQLPLCRSELAQMRFAMLPGPLSVGGQREVPLRDRLATFRVRTDEHLEVTCGTVEVLCTIQDRW